MSAPLLPRVDALIGRKLAAHLGELFEAVTLALKSIIDDVHFPQGEFLRSVRAPKTISLFRARAAD